MFNFQINTLRFKFFRFTALKESEKWTELDRRMTIYEKANQGIVRPYIPKILNKRMTDPLICYKWMEAQNGIQSRKQTKMETGIQELFRTGTNRRVVDECVTLFRFVEETPSVEL